MKDYNVELKFRNNLLLQKMREHGIETASELARCSNNTPTAVGNYLNLKAAPVTIHGISPSAQKLLNLFSCELEDIFPEQHIYNPLVKNKAEVVLSLDEVKSIAGDVGDPHALLEADEMKGMISMALQTLGPRRKKVVEMKMGLNGYAEHTFNEIGEEFGFSGGRANQLFRDAISKIKKNAPKNGHIRQLRQFV